MQQWDREEHIRREAEENGIDKINATYAWLQKNGRMKDVERAFTDEAFRNSLLMEYENTN